MAATAVLIGSVALATPAIRTAVVPARTAGSQAGDQGPGLTIPSGGDSARTRSQRPTSVARLFAWGGNELGQMTGDGRVRRAPESVVDLDEATSVAAGAYHTLATIGGVVRAWGSNAYGQLGDGTTVDHRRPVRVSAVDDVTVVAAGRLHSLVLRSDGTVWAWGRNDRGQLGDGTTVDRPRPARVGGLDKVVALAAGRIHSLAVRSDGTVWAWGGNDDADGMFTGQTGSDTGPDQTRPVMVADLTDVQVVAAGNGDYSLAVRSNGTVWAWGDNSRGQLGDGTTGTRWKPAPVPGLGRIVKVAGSATHTVAVDADGTVWSWGENGAGALGDGTTASRLSPVKLDLPAATSVACGLHHTLARTRDGAVWAWGDNSDGQLGDGTNVSRVAPVKVSGVSGATAVSAGVAHSVAVGF
ncbi:MAG: RCC1 domain-containing protein [Acidimicrobiales bacterium]